MSVETSPRPLTIVGLEIENFKRIKAISIKPSADNSIVAISGANAQGKSSILDAIWMGLISAKGARESNTTVPVRHGADKAVVKIDLGDFLVIRTWNATGTTKLEIMSTDTGAKFSSPQKMLDALLGSLSFDPLAFTRMSSKEQIQTLLSVVNIGIDLDELAARRKDIYDRRTQTGREITALGTLPDVLPALPIQEESPIDLIAQITEAQQAAARQQDMVAQRDRIAGNIDSLQAQIDSLMAQKQAAVDELARADEAIAQAPRIEDTSVLTDRLARIEETNQRIRSNNQARDIVAKAAALNSVRDQFTADIEALDESKARALANAQFPLEGLSFDEEGITFQDVPLGQASTAEQLRVSCALAISLNPSIRILRVTDGSLLDSSSMQVLEELATEHGFQIWMEVVDESGTVGIVIEDGEVKSIN